MPLIRLLRPPLSTVASCLSLINMLICALIYGAKRSRPSMRACSFSFILLGDQQTLWRANGAGWDPWQQSGLSGLAVGDRVSKTLPCGMNCREAVECVYFCFVFVHLWIVCVLKWFSGTPPLDDMKFYEMLNVFSGWLESKAICIHEIVSFVEL